ncbi:MAG: hypothetical protein WEE89_08960 [Gemmatimonadota bacterium]
MRELRTFRASLASHATLDAELARANLDVRVAELESAFLHDHNPAAWTGEAIFAAVSLRLRPFAPRDQRLESLIQRLYAIPQFLDTMRASVASLPARWSRRAQPESRAAEQMFGKGLDAWLALEPAPPERVAQTLAVNWE